MPETSLEVFLMAARVESLTDGCSVPLASLYPLPSVAQGISPSSREASADAGDGDAARSRCMTETRCTISSTCSLAAHRECIESAAAQKSVVRLLAASHLECRVRFPVGTARLCSGSPTHVGGAGSVGRLAVHCCDSNLN